MQTYVTMVANPAPQEQRDSHERDEENTLAHRLTAGLEPLAGPENMCDRLETARSTMDIRTTFVL